MRRDRAKMTDKELRHLKRPELIEIIYELQKQNIEISSRVDSLEQEMNDRTADSDLPEETPGKRKRSVELPAMEQIEAERGRLEYKAKYAGVLRSTVGVLIVAAAIAILIATLWMPVLQIYGSSMNPTLEDGQIVVAIKGSDYETGDVCAFWLGNKLLVKRVIAGPSSWVSIDEGGNVYVDGELLEEPYLEEKSQGSTDLTYPYQVGEARYFMMGDNRSTSIDSRNTQVGCISDEYMVGRIIFRIWPLANFGTVD